MQRHFIGLVGLSVLLLGCGSVANTHSSGASSGASDVVISTDRTTYTPSSTIAVTVQNTSTTAIYAMDMLSSCSILSLQYQDHGTWRPSQVAQCPQKRRTSIVKIDAGATYTAAITAGYPGWKQSTFPPGTYRLVLLYTTSSTLSALQSSGTTVASPSIQVKA